MKEIQELTAEVDVHGFFDFGRDAYGQLEVELDGTFAENTELVIGEVAQDGRIVHVPGFRTFLHHIFPLRNGHHVYRFEIPTHLPAYHGFPHCLAPAEARGEVAPFRYAEVNRYYGKATVRRIAWFGDWHDDAAHFECDNPALNRVWEFCKYSIKATSLFDKYVDGERERMPYEGDAYINQLGHFCCDADYGTARRTIEHFLDQGQYTWPTEWLLLTPLLVRDYVLYSGDTAALQSWLPRMDGKLLLKFLDRDGLLSPAAFEDGKPNFVFDAAGAIAASKIRDIVDWPETERDGYEMGTVNFVPNAYLYRALLVMAELSGQAEYRDRAAALRRAVRAKMLKNGLFVDAPESDHTALHSAMFALDFGLVDPQEIAAHCAVIRAHRLDCSVYGAQFLMDACYRHRLADHALELLGCDDRRSWRNMLREGATITMESWGDGSKGNQDWTHPWGAAPANVIPRRLCGVRPVAPGFARFAVDPQPASLETFFLRQPTLRGPIELRKTGDEYMLTVPPGTVAVCRERELPPGEHRWKACCPAAD